MNNLYNQKKRANGGEIPGHDLRKDITDTKEKLLKLEEDAEAAHSGFQNADTPITNPTIAATRRQLAALESRASAQDDGPARNTPSITEQDNYPTSGPSGPSVVFGQQEEEEDQRLRNASK